MIAPSKACEWPNRAPATTPCTAMRQVHKRPVPTGDQILAIADRVRDLGGLSAQVM